jgi:hypothetical protein
MAAVGSCAEGVFGARRGTRWVHGERRSEPITGVRVKLRSGEVAPAPRKICLGDLIVDAAGRGSVAPKWLEKLGYGAHCEESMYKID